ncbi:hypothetical protein SELMODRAFT_111930 [Selaginella moellendorffii]|uniref:CRAL-TRIO domain-containing protein n=1 Tax=Selaginella moellendorffii TaxID=88036 RepID=D8S9X5_SELML|nr:hypothetical protein SELMODRAFT_136216 [Selaginella moellendorffii]EFJ19028.1 hypothetical protein SELMODRAFT_111930 [Selaginella moellendorffii]
MASKKKRNGEPDREGSEQPPQHPSPRSSIWRNRSKGDDPASPEEEQAKVDSLRSALGSLTDKSQRYCTDACLKRYLRARNWNLKKAEKMLKDSLKWRATFKPESIRWEDIAIESETGKVYRANFVDNYGRAILIMRPARQNTKDQNGQIRQLVYCLENAVLNLPPDQEQMVWLIDFHGWSVSNSVPLSAARETANVLQNHYPERLGVAILYNPPRIFEAFWAVIKPFLDPKTYKKVKFVYSKDPDSVKLLEDVFDMEKLDTSFGGRGNCEYNHEDYGRMMKQDDVKMQEHWR